jgi:hypothetical protein
MEEMHSMELQRRTAAVREAQRAIDVQDATLRSAGFDGRGALIVGDQLGRAAAETQREAAVWRRRRLEEARLEREAAKDKAREVYIASRLKCEQMKSVVAGLTEYREMDAARRMQAASDDRFLARRRWTDMRDTTRADG